MSLRTAKRKRRSVEVCRVDGDCVGVSGSTTPSSSRLVRLRRAYLCFSEGCLRVNSILARLPVSRSTASITCQEANTVEDQMR